jgi:two-component system OmpR family response regulator
MPDAAVLIVEEEEELAENLRDLLEFEGYAVATCSTGEEALEKTSSETPDLVLLDIQLPGMNGLEVLRRLKGKYPTLPVAIVSALSQKETRKQMEECGADGMLLKPYDQDELLRLIESLLHRSAG